MFVCETPRLRLRRLHGEDDAPFILALVNEPSWLENIGDRGVRTLDDARAYIANGPLVSYAQHGFGLFCAELRETGEAIGMCGLLKRDWLADVDVGFAFFPKFWGKGYAHESAAAVIDWARTARGVTRVAGIVKPGNSASIRVLEKLGMRFSQVVTSPDGVKSCLYTPPERSA
jgi:[ribosomal protein S5]-alanine N-acetyltransferase